MTTSSSPRSGGRDDRNESLEPHIRVQLAQAHDEKDHGDVVPRAVLLLPDENAEDHGEDDSRGLDQGLGGIVEELHGEVRHAQIDRAQDGQDDVGEERDPAVARGPDPGPPDANAGAGQRGRGPTRDRR